MRRMALAAAVLSGLAPSGCSTIGPVAGTLPGTSGSSYVAGRATQLFAYPPEAMRSAVIAAMDDLPHRIGPAGPRQWLVAVQRHDRRQPRRDGRRPPASGDGAGQRPRRLVRRRAALAGADGSDRHPPRRLAAVGHPRRAAEYPRIEPVLLARGDPRRGDAPRPSRRNLSRLARPLIAGPNGARAVPEDGSLMTGEHQGAVLEEVPRSWAIDPPRFGRSVPRVAQRTKRGGKGQPRPASSQHPAAMDRGPCG